MKKIILWSLLFVALSACKKDDKETVIELKNDTRYTFVVTAKGYWTAETHPQDFPTAAKFGKILGVSHKDENVLFRKGNKAADWMTSYFDAESTSAFVSKYQEYKDNGKVDAIMVEDGLDTTGDTSFEFNTEGKYDKVSLLMQLSPSPDWFVAINNVNLNALALGGYATYVVKVWDAGLYSGATYTEKGSSTNENIANKTGAPLNYPNGGINKFATITIQFKSLKKIDGEN